MMICQSGFAFCLTSSTQSSNGDEFGEVLDPLENAGGSQKKRRNTKSKAITLPDLEPYFGLPLDIAAKMFGVGRTTFRTRCRERGLPEWPYKKRNVNTVRNQQREIKFPLVDIDTCPEMDYKAVGRTAFRELGKKRNDVNTVCDQLRDIELFPMDIDTCPEMRIVREMERFLMDIDTCPEMDYEAAGNQPALEKIMQEFKALI